MHTYAKNSTLSRLVWDANAAAASSFWDTKMADGTSWEKGVSTTMTIAWKQRKSINTYVGFPDRPDHASCPKEPRRLHTARLRDRRSAHATEKTIMEKPYLIIRCKNGIVRCCVYSFYVEVLIFGSQLHCQRLNFKHWDHWDHTIRRWVIAVYSNCSTSGRLTKRRWWPDIKKLAPLIFCRNHCLFAKSFYQIISGHDGSLRYSAKTYNTRHISWDSCDIFCSPNVVFGELASQKPEIQHLEGRSTTFWWNMRVLQAVSQLNVTRIVDL